MNPLVDPPDFVTIVMEPTPPSPLVVLGPAETVTAKEAMRGLVPFFILIAVVVAATGPWSHLSDYNFVKPAVDAVSSLSGKATSVSWSFAPAIAGTWILASWILIAIVLRARPPATSRRPAGA